MAEWYSSKTKEIATKRAEKLKKKLEKVTGGKWKIRVHENLGWHYDLTCGSMSVSQYGDKSFSVLMSDEKGNTGGGAGIWDYPSGYESVEEAIRYQLKEARSVVNSIEEAVADTEKRLPLITNKNR